MSARGTVIAACSAILSFSLLSAGCTTKVQGSPRISICAKHELAKCTDYTPVQPKKGKMIDVWLNSQKRAANMLCSALSDKQLSKFMGESYYRYLRYGKACRIMTEKRSGGASQRLMIEAALYPQPMEGYRVVDGNKRTSIAGHPAWINQFESSIGERYVEYTVATGKTPDKGGVMFIKVSVMKSRGDYTERPLDYTLLNHRDEIAKAFINAVL